MVALGDGADSANSLAALIASTPAVCTSSAFLPGLEPEASTGSTSSAPCGKLKRNTIRSYDRIAEQFEAVWCNHPPKQILDRFLEYLRRDSDILDAGCGPGHHARYLASHSHNVLGIDLSDGMLRVAEASVHQATFRKMDIQHLDFPARNFDAIWCAASALHVPREEMIQLLLGYKRVLRHGGMLGLNLQIQRPSEVVEHGPDQRFFEYYQDSAAIRSLLELAGFDVVAEDYGETSRNTHELELVLKWITLYAKPRTTDGGQ
jgi:ubiquinone/menaquinone biosynthesis C-methylase UbiE